MATNSRVSVPTEVVRQNRLLDARLRERWPPMNLKAWKVLKNLVVSLAIVGFGIFSVVEGADPLRVFSLGIVVLGLVNGMELSEFYAAWAQVQRPADVERGTNSDENA